MSTTTLCATRTQGHGLRLLVATGLLALAAGAALPVWAQCGPGSPGPRGPGMGPPHLGGPGMDGPGMMMAGDPTHVARMIDRLLDGMGATDAQRSQIRQIAQAAAADLNAERDADRALHDRAIELLAAPTVDAAAAESLRQQMQARHDQASKRMLQAMLDMSKVLTPEQRAKLAQRMKQRDEMMRDRMQRMQRPPEQKG